MTVTIPPAVTLAEAKRIWPAGLADDAWQLVHHTYVGISFRVMKKTAFRRAPGRCVGRINVLVDPTTHHVMTCDLWDSPATPPATTGDEAIIARARRVVAPVVMRQLGLMTNFHLIVDAYEPQVRTPHWLVTGSGRHGLIDGLTGQITPVAWPEQ